MCAMMLACRSMTDEHIGRLLNVLVNVRRGGYQCVKSSGRDITVREMLDHCGVSLSEQHTDILVGSLYHIKTVNYNLILC